MYRKQLDNHFFGAVLTTKYISEPLDLQFGGAANSYMGDHFGTLHYLEDTLILPINYEYYRNDAKKIDANIYAKANWRIINRGQQKLSLYADLQYRYVHYERNGVNDEALARPSTLPAFPSPT